MSEVPLYALFQRQQEILLLLGTDFSLGPPNRPVWSDTGGTGTILIRVPGAEIRISSPTIRISGFGYRDSGFGSEDSGFGLTQTSHDVSIGNATWLRYMDTAYVHGISTRVEFRVSRLGLRVLGVRACGTRTPNASGRKISCGWMHRSGPL